MRNPEKYECRTGKVSKSLPTLFSLPPAVPDSAFMVACSACAVDGAADPNCLGCRAATKNRMKEIRGGK